jgi:hypothetical protein
MFNILKRKKKITVGRGLVGGGYFVTVLVQRSTRLLVWRLPVRLGLFSPSLFYFIF